MNKKEFSEKLAKKADISIAKASEIVNIIFSCKDREGIIAIELDAGRSLTIPGFGTFSSKHRKERQGINPATGKAITIAAKNYPTFKAGKTLKDRVAE